MSGKRTEAVPHLRAGVIVSLLALTAVLILPALRTYHFGRSYKPVEAQSAVRHWSLDVNEERAVKTIDQLAENPSFARLVPALTSTVAPHYAIPATPQIGIPRLLRRLRLGNSRAPDLPPLS